MGEGRSVRSGPQVYSVIDLWRSCRRTRHRANFLARADPGLPPEGHTPVVRE